MDHRSRQLAFFRAKAGQKTGFRVMLKYFELVQIYRSLLWIRESDWFIFATSSLD